jgi:hypothetical protein
MAAYFNYKIQEFLIEVSPENFIDFTQTVASIEYIEDILLKKGNENNTDQVKIIKRNIMSLKKMAGNAGISTKQLINMLQSEQESI